MRKIDIVISFLAGLGVAWLAFGIIRDYGLEIKYLSWFLAIFLPFLALFGLWVCYLVGKKFLFVFQAGKFLLIGVLATLVDLGVFKFLALISGLTTSWALNTFKGISFIVATFAKYWGNKFWAFEKMERREMGKEISQFYLVTIIGLGINVGAFSLIVNTIGPQFGTPFETWKTIGVIGAAFAAALWNFLSYKFIVFKK